jgi:hypothetical protein
VRRYVRKRKRETGLIADAIFVPQSYQLGQEAQVDWYEAIARLGGDERKLYFFSMRSMASGDAFHGAYPHATQQALLDAHEKAFAYFGGVFRTLRYDNMGSLVKKILRGYQRIETERIIEFRTHWGFQSEYCNPAKGNEKGGVEGELGRFRRNYLVPVPEATDLDAFNARLLADCIENRQRTIGGRVMTVGEASEQERAVLLPLAEEGFRLDELIYPLIVDGKGRVRVKTNWYSAPAPAGSRVAVSVGRWRCQSYTTTSAWHGISDVMDAATRFSTWSITWMFWSTSRERWPVRSRWSSGAKRAAGRCAWTRSGAGWSSVTAGARARSR